MNEVESATARLSRGAATGARTAWDWFTDLGQGAWLLALAVLTVGAVVVAVIVGHNGGSPCDQATRNINDVRTYDGNSSLLSGAVPELRIDAAQLDALAGQASGAQRQALAALAQVAREARADHPFHAQREIAAVRAACS